MKTIYSLCLFIFVTGPINTQTISGHTAGGIGSNDIGLDLSQLGNTNIVYL